MLKEITFEGYSCYYLEYIKKEFDINKYMLFIDWMNGQTFFRDNNNKTLVFKRDYDRFNNNYK